MWMGPLFIGSKANAKAMATKVVPNASSMSHHVVEQTPKTIKNIV